MALTFSAVSGSDDIRTGAGTVSRDGPRGASGTSYTSQIEFTHRILELGFARCKDLDKHESSQGSDVFARVQIQEGFFF